ncbi:hypothetical protein P5G62_020590 [Neobacillus sp. 179-C4.2 HS]|uniref:Uncharacterized protein n=1 Tax=Neobacillus driksii TaxID=3035913 RepID=A0ABV4YXE3_9BACI|nr:hypothetical protein [Neobacillus sp. 179.-C4.2 HS]MDP5195743.1 hypothetical protein [Neobacillus sp. 179.-C4.2 HS]
MIYKRTISLLVILITILSIFATSYAIMSNQGPGEYEYQSIIGETVSIYGKGLYSHDSVSMAAQAIAQDYVTLFLGVPLLLLSFYLYRKGFLKGSLLLTGTLGYFLYTYASYSFLSMYNSMFLTYVALMSASFFAFILMMMSYDVEKLPLFFTKKMPVKFLGGFLLFGSFVFGMMWTGKLCLPLLNNTPPADLQHYTTYVIQALDLGFVVPTGLLAGILLIMRKPFGYLLAPVIIIKEITLLTALTAMILLQLKAGVEIGYLLVWSVILFNLLVIICMILIMKNIKENVEKPRTGMNLH